MAITLETVDPSDLIDAGRTKFNANDATLAAAASGLTSLVNQHATDGHPSLYYSKAEIQSIVKKRTVILQFGWLSGQGMFQTMVGGVAVPAIPNPFSSGSVTRVKVRSDSGQIWDTVFADGFYALASQSCIAIQYSTTIAGDDLNANYNGFVMSILPSGQSVPVCRMSATPAENYVIEVEVTES